VLDDPSFSHDTAGNEKLSLGNSWVKPGWSVPQFTFSAATWSALATARADHAWSRRAASIASSRSTVLAIRRAICKT